MNQPDQVVVGVIFISYLLRHYHHPPVGKLVSRAGVGEAKIGGELVCRGVYPPTFQEAEPDDNSNSYEDTEDGDGGEHLGQGETTLLPWRNRAP